MFVELDFKDENLWLKLQLQAKNMDESHKFKSRERNQNTVKYILYEYTRIRNKTQQHSSV